MVDANILGMLPQKNGAVNPNRCSRYYGTDQIDQSSGRISTVHPPCQRNHHPSVPLRHNTRDRGCHRPVAKADPCTSVARNTCAKAENGQPIKNRRPSSSVTLGALSNSWINVITFLSSGSLRFTVPNDLQGRHNCWALRHNHISKTIISANRCHINSCRSGILPLPFNSKKDIWSMGDLQDPKMEVPLHRLEKKALHRPYIWNRYLQSIGSWVMASDLKLIWEASLWSQTSHCIQAMR